MAEESNVTVSSASLRKIASTPSITLACFVVQDPPSLRDDSLLFQEAPYLHSTVPLSCRVVSEDGRNYKFSPGSASKSPSLIATGQMMSW